MLRAPAQPVCPTAQPGCVPRGLRLRSRGLCPSLIEPQTSPEIGIWPGVSRAVGPAGAGCPRVKPLTPRGHRVGARGVGAGFHSPRPHRCGDGRGESTPGVSVLADPQDKLLPNREQRGTCQEVYTHLGTGFSRCDSPCSTLTQLNQLLQLLVPGLGRSCLSIPSTGGWKRLFHPWGLEQGGGDLPGTRRASDRDIAVALGTRFYSLN